MSSLLFYNTALSFFILLSHLYYYTLMIKASYPDTNIDTRLFTFHAGGSGSGGPSDLTRETGTLDGLRAFFDLVLIAAAMDSHHLTCALLHLIRY